MNLFLPQKKMLGRMFLLLFSRQWQWKVLTIYITYITPKISTYFLSHHSVQVSSSVSSFVFSSSSPEQPARLRVRGEPETIDEAGQKEREKERFCKWFCVGKGLYSTLL